MHQNRESLDEMIKYALKAPDIDQCRSILWDALHGCTGADNQAEIHEKFETWEDHKEMLMVYEDMLNEEAKR